MQSSLYEIQPTPLHVAIIMDGNGRWANARGLPRIEGHRQGINAVRSVVEAAPQCGIRTLTVYAFSSDNWKRPKFEVQTLMQFFYDYLHKENDRCIENGVRISVIGQRNRLPLSLRAAIDMAERTTAQGQKLHFRIAIDYSSRDAILRAAAQMHFKKVYTRLTFSQSLNEVNHKGVYAPDVDLLIRTSGEKRLSDFLLWECAYAELYFTDCLWPDFTEQELKEAIDDYYRRNRRFGAVEAGC